MSGMFFADPAPSPSSNDTAREYESIHNKLFLVRIVLTIVLLAIYLLSGASAHLADGLRSRFGSIWLLVNGLYIIVTVFGYAVFTFPMSLYGDFVLEHRYGLSKQGLESWLIDFFKSLAIEMALALVFFETIYAFLHFAPNFWWVWATVFYVLFVVVLSSIAPVVIMPLFHKFEPMDNPSLVDAVKAFAEKEGLKVLGVFRWGLEEKTSTANAALAGLGKTRRIILGDTMLSGYTQDEIIAVLAHEVGHYKHRDMLRLIVVGAVMAALGFFLAHLILRMLVAQFGFQGAADIGSFPLFVFCLFVFSLIIMPVSNAHSRRREFLADDYAVQAMKSAAPLVGALDKLAVQNLADKEPAPWIEFLLYGHPSIARRIRRARQTEADHLS